MLWHHPSVQHVWKLLCIIPLLWFHDSSFKLQWLFLRVGFIHLGSSTYCFGIQEISDIIFFLLKEFWTSIGIHYANSAGELLHSETVTAILQINNLFPPPGFKFSFSWIIYLICCLIHLYLLKKATRWPCKPWILSSLCFPCCTWRICYAFTQFLCFMFFLC